MKRNKSNRIVIRQTLASVGETVIAENISTDGARILVTKEMQAEFAFAATLIDVVAFSQTDFIMQGSPYEGTPINTIYVTGLTGGLSIHVGKGFETTGMLGIAMEVSDTG